MAQYNSEILIDTLYYIVRHRGLYTENFMLDFINIFKENYKDGPIDKNFIYNIGHVLEKAGIDFKVLLCDENFKPESYKHVYDNIEKVRNSLNAYTSQNPIKLSAEDVSNIMSITLSFNNLNINNLSDSLDLISNDNKTLLFDGNKFIEQYNKEKISTLNILEVIKNFNLYKLFNISDKNYDELLVLKTINENILTNNKYINVIKFISFDGYISNYVNPNNDYNKIVNFAILNLNIDSNLNLKNNLLALIDIGVVSSKNTKDNLLLIIMTLIPIDNKELKELLKILKVKSNNLYECISGLTKISNSDIYNIKDNYNIDKIQEYINTYLIEVFNRINLYNTILSLLNTDIDNTSLKDIFLDFAKQSNICTKLTKDSQSVEKCDELFKSLIFEDKKDIYKGNASDTHLLSNIAHIFNAKGKLNTEYLKLTFNNYIDALYLICINFLKSDIYFLYKNTMDFMLGRSSANESYNDEYLMFKDITLSHILYEEEKNSSENNLGNNLKILAKEADKTDLNIIDYIKLLPLNKVEDTSNNSNIDNTDPANTVKLNAKTLDIEIQ